MSLKVMVELLGAMKVCCMGALISPFPATAAVSVHFSQEVYIVGESSGPAALELVLEGTAAIPVIVTVGTLQLVDSSVGEEATGRPGWFRKNASAIGPLDKEC